MTLNFEDRQTLIKYRIEQAKETIDDARLMIDNNKYRSAVNRIYYAMFYSLLAFGLKHNYETGKHTKLIGWFNKEFVHSGLIDKKFGRIINRAYLRRTKGDYDTYVEFDKETINTMFSDMIEFIDTIEKSIHS
ncbi:MAG: hypothetical protein A2033_05515 [Bacteroidetes bacterium GWA2_31_9]|nr:MAG: hypothetical protein A2033_05515 [Bacteroidetes bacterium GWA2_31_9]